MDAIAAENKDLQAKIDALKLKLGIPIVAEQDEKTRIEKIFKQFDLDNNGTIDKAEFELLAFRCGCDVEQLLPANLDKSFATLDQNGDGKIDFSEFFAWLQSEKSSGGSKVAPGQLGLLRLKLQSKAWMKNFTDFKAESKGDGKPSSDSKDKQTSGGSGGASSDRKDGDSGKPAPESKGEQKGDKDKSSAQVHRTFNFQLAVGEVKAPKAGIYVKSGENVKLAKDTRELLNAPEEAPLVLCIDFGLQEGFNEEQVGELIGILDQMINGVPWAEFPMQVYHSHAVDVVDDGEKSSQKLLRVSFFSPLDPERIAQQMMGRVEQQGGPRLMDVFKGGFKIELPFSLDELADTNFRFTADKLQMNMNGVGEVDKTLEAKAQELIQRLPPNLQQTMKVRLAMAKFVKGIDWTFKFASLSDLLDAVPAFNEDDNPMGLPPRPIQRMQQDLEKLADQHIAEHIAAWQQMAGQGVGQIPPPFNQIYALVQQNLSGLRRIHVQLHAQCATTDIKGLDFIPLLPDPPAPMGGAGGDGAVGYPGGDPGYGGPAGYDGQDAYRD